MFEVKRSWCEGVIRGGGGEGGGEVVVWTM